MTTISNVIHDILKTGVKPAYIVITAAQMAAYKRELVPDTLPDIALSLMVRIRAHGFGHTTIVVTRIITEDGSSLENGQDLPLIVIEDPENRVVRIRT